MLSLYSSVKDSKSEDLCRMSSVTTITPNNDRMVARRAEKVKYGTVLYSLPPAA